MAERWIQGETSLLTMPVPKWFKKPQVETREELSQILGVHLMNLLRQEEWEQGTEKENAEARLEAATAMLKELNSQGMALGVDSRELAAKDWGAMDALLDGNGQLWEKLMFVDNLSLPAKLVSKEELNNGTSESLLDWARTLVDL